MQPARAHTYYTCTVTARYVTVPDRNLQKDILKPGSTCLPEQNIKPMQAEVAATNTSVVYTQLSFRLVCCEEHHEVVAPATAPAVAPRALLVQGLKGPQDGQVVRNARRRSRRSSAILGAVGLQAIIIVKVSRSAQWLLLQVPQRPPQGLLASCGCQRPRRTCNMGCVPVFCRAASVHTNNKQTLVVHWTLKICRSGAP